eukprot:scaffold119355_cov36-Phaeocystis_antarctica.AAC.1
MMRSSERKPGPSSPTRSMYHGMMATCSRAGGLGQEVWGGRSGQKVRVRAAVLGRRRRSGPELGQARAGWGRLGQVGGRRLSELGRSRTKSMTLAGFLQKLSRPTAAGQQSRRSANSAEKIMMHPASMKNHGCAVSAKTRPVWPASADHAAEWPRLAEAGSSLRDGLARKAALESQLAETCAVLLSTSRCVLARRYARKAKVEH